MNSINNFGRFCRTVLASALVIASLMAVGTSARATPVENSTPVCSLESNTCVITFIDPSQVQTWVAPSWVDSVTMSVAGGVGGSSSIKDSTNTWAPSVVEPFYAITTIGDIDLSTVSDRTFTIAVGGGGTLLAAGTNPLGDFTGGDSASFTGIAAGDEHIIGGGGAATVVTNNAHTYVLAGTAGASNHAVKSTTTSGSKHGDHAILFGSVGSGQYFGGGGGGVIGGVAGSSGTSLLSGLARYTGIEYRQAGADGYVSFEYAAPQSPSAPTIDSIDSGDHSLSINFESPINYRGEEVSNYEYSLNSGGTWITFEPTTISSPLVIEGLTNGLSYLVKIRAVNDTGVGPGSNEISAIPYTVPAAPTISGVTSVNKNLIVAYLSGTNGGSVVTNYDYSLDGGDNWTELSQNSITSPITIGLLEAGSSNDVVLRAVNAAGNSESSNIFQATVITTPSSPTINSVTPSDQQLSVAFDEPISNGYSEILNYQYSLTSGATWVNFATSSNPLIVSGLTNGTSYSIKLRAVNSSGKGTVSNTVSATPRKLANAPTIDSATSSNGKINLSFTAPTDNGGSPITNYEYSPDGGTSWTALSPVQTTGEITLAGLTLGTQYELKLRAVNSAGSGASSASKSAIVITNATAPVITSITSSDQQLIVDFNVPISDGSSAITNYQYSLNGGTNWETYAPSSTSSPLVISSLNNGTSYSIKLRAVNGSGNGAASNSILGTPRKIASAPTITSATSTEGKLDISFTAPSSDGGSAIANYEYSTDNGSSWSVLSPAKTSGTISISGLNVGTHYDVKLRALNGAGSGIASSTSNVLVVTHASAPTISSITSGTGQIRIDFIAPIDDGAKAISNYEYSTDNGTSWTSVSPATTSGPIVVTGLSNGTTYQVKIRAFNGSGFGEASASSTAKPYTTSDAPTLTSAAIDNGNLSISFTPPTATGGSPVTSYEYSVDNGANWIGGVTSSPYLVGALDSNINPQVRLRALNLRGAGVASNTITKPGSPFISSIDSGDMTLSSNFASPVSNGGQPILSYLYSIDNGAHWLEISPADISKPLIISGLTNGSAYTVKIRAVNALGTGEVTASSAAPGTVPDAPLISSVGSANGRITFIATDGPSNGGSAVIGMAYSFDAGLNWTSLPLQASGSLYSISGLANLTEYHLQLRAKNSAGWGNLSTDHAVTPHRTVPSAPVISSSVADNAKIMLNYSMPTDDGGSSITGYEYSINNGVSWFAATSVSGQIRISGLVNGTMYKVILRAINTTGSSLKSNEASNTPMATVPAMPQGSAVIGSNNTINISLRLIDDGGEPITGYDYAINGSTVWLPATYNSGSPSSVSIPNQRNDFASLVRLRAKNIVGTSTASADMAGFAGLHDERLVINTIATMSKGMNVIFTAPTAPPVGGASLNQMYQFSTDNGLTWSPPRKPSTTEALRSLGRAYLPIRNLVNGSIYNVRLRTAYTKRYAATYISGWGPVSLSKVGIPSDVPSSPKINSIVSGNAKLTVSFSAPASNGGSAITNYAYSFGGSTWINIQVPQTTSPIVILGLTNGRSYSVRIRAINISGPGAVSSVMVMTPRLTAP